MGRVLIGTESQASKVKSGQRTMLSGHHWWLLKQVVL